MKSKEALKSICLECEREKGENKIACPFRSISNEYCEEYDSIKKDLDLLSRLVVENGLLKKDLIDYQEYIKKGVEEHYKDFMSDYDLLLQEYQELYKRLEILEILKKHYDKDSLTLSFISSYIDKEDTDFKKVKEWLENDN